jgi:hypothetical protein
VIFLGRIDWGAIMISKSIVVMGALTLLSAAAHAGSAPKELYGKSIIISWTEHRNQRHIGQTNFRDVGVPLSRKIILARRVNGSAASLPRLGTGRTVTVAEGNN